jgi:hypothetical protein
MPTQGQSQSTAIDKPAGKVTRNSSIGDGYETCGHPSQLELAADQNA